MHKVHLIRMMQNISKMRAEAAGYFLMSRERAPELRQPCKGIDNSLVDLAHDTHLTEIEYQGFGRRSALAPRPTALRRTLSSRHADQSPVLRAAIAMSLIGSGPPHIVRGLGRERERKVWSPQSGTERVDGCRKEWGAADRSLGS